MLYNVFCTHINVDALNKYRNNPGTGLFYHKKMKEDWEAVDDSIIIHEALLWNILQVTQVPKRLDIESALRQFNSLQPDKLFVEDEEQENSFRSQSMGIKLMLKRIGNKARNLKTGGRTHPVIIKLTQQYLRAPVPSPVDESVDLTTPSLKRLSCFFFC
jgi:hypothetical protein